MYNLFLFLTRPLRFSIAISSLSGAAATNATLTWIGGGSLASGGLGVLGGTIILTGGSSLIGIGAGYLMYKHLKKKRKN